MSVRVRARARASLKVVRVSTKVISMETSSEISTKLAPAQG